MNHRSNKITRVVDWKFTYLAHGPIDPYLKVGSNLPFENNYVCHQNNTVSQGRLEACQLQQASSVSTNCFSRLEM
jgi:hypothetical protein